MEGRLRGAALFLCPGPWKGPSRPIGKRHAAVSRPHAADPRSRSRAAGPDRNRDLVLVRRADALRPRRRLSLTDDQRSEEHTSELQSRFDLVCRLLLEKKKNRLNLSPVTC